MKPVFSALLLAMAISGCEGGSETPTEQPLKFEDVPVVEFGETAQAEGLEFELIDVAEKSQIGMEGLGPAASPEETFVAIRYRVKNLSKEPMNRWDFPSVDLVDATGQAYAMDNEASALEGALSDDVTGRGDLNPNVAARLVAVWKVDKATFKEDEWRVMVSFDSAIADAIAWPLDADSPTPILFALK